MRLAWLPVYLLSAAIGAPCSAAEETPAPLPLIGRTRATVLCKAVRDVVAPAVLGLMKTDELLESSHRVYGQMARHTGLRQNLDRVELGKIVTGMARNLAAVHALLDEAPHVPKAATTDDDHTVGRLRRELQSVAERESRALDIVNGVLETDLLLQMMGGLKHVPTYGGQGRYYDRVAEAVAERQADVKSAEAELAPSIVAASQRCGAQPSPPPSPGPGS